MIRSAASTVMWVGRVTVFFVGLAVVLALLFGVATAALGTTGGTFILGKANNTAESPTGLVSTLVDASKSALIVTNTSGGPALDLRVGNPNADPPIAPNDVAPMKVNSNKVVAKLNADKIDGQNSTAFLRVGAKAADSEELDGQDSAAFFTGDTYSVFGPPTDNSTAENTSTEAYCDAGDTVLSGGYTGLNTNEGIVISTRPESAGTGEEGWTVLWKNASPSLNADGQAIALCGDFLPAHIPTF